MLQIAGLVLVCLIGWWIIGKIGLLRFWGLQIMVIAIAVIIAMVIGLSS